jgi:DNA-binding response OmpR family regulator
MGLVGRMARVFVVDDDPEVVELLILILEQEGHEVAGFTTVEAARRAIEVAPPALVLLDLTMPEVAGTEFCRELKRDLRTRDVPVIFLSGQCHLEQEASSAGADGFLCKPFAIDEVARCVAEHLALQERAAGGA